LCEISIFLATHQLNMSTGTYHSKTENVKNIQFNVQQQAARLHTSHISLHSHEQHEELYQTENEPSTPVFAGAIHSMCTRHHSRRYHLKNLHETSFPISRHIAVTLNVTLYHIPYCRSGSPYEQGANLILAPHNPKPSHPTTCFPRSPEQRPRYNPTPP
jgi:hypothetical protein